MAAKDKSDPKGEGPVIVPLELPDAATRARLKVEAKRGNDNDLPARDRRNRQRISPSTDIAEDAVVTVIGEPASIAQKNVVGPARGEGWMLLSWREDGCDCYGTYHESQVSL